MECIATHSIFFSGRGHIPFLLEPTRSKKFEGEEFYFIFKFLRWAPLYGQKTGWIDFYEVELQLVEHWFQPWPYNSTTFKSLLIFISYRYIIDSYVVVKDIDAHITNLIMFKWTILALCRASPLVVGYRFDAATGNTVVYVGENVGPYLRYYN